MGSRCVLQPGHEPFSLDTHHVLPWGGGSLPWDEEGVCECAAYRLPHLKGSSSCAVGKS